MNLKPYLSLFAGLLLSVVAATRAYAQKNYGFVEQENIKVAGITQDSMIYNLPVTQKQTTRVFLDGMGRAVQTIGVQASPGQNDLIQPVAYDNLGRQTTQYLPYAGKATDTMGRYRPNALPTDQAAFYNQTTQYLIAKDANPYAQQVIEASPLQRMQNAGTVGTGFQPVSGQHYKTASYRYNTSGDGNILIWNPDGTFTTGKYYGVSTLSVTDGKDEDSVETLVFTDRAGRTVMKRQILSTGNLDTYYVYDLAGMVSYIIPPKALALMITNGNYSLTQAGVNKLIFHYVYDTMGRIVEKTVPAKGVEYVVYDPVNRPVLTQDSNMRVSNKWAYVKYDAKGRVINTGTYTDGTTGRTTRSGMQTYVNGMSSSYNTAWFESRTTSSTFYYYTNNIFPASAAGPTPLAFNYYDDYDVDNDGTANFSYNNQGLSGEVGATTAAIRGMPTVVLTTYAGSGITGTQWYTKQLFYDKRGNTIQVKSSNHMYSSGLFGVSDISTTVPDFIGMPLISKVAKKSSATITTVVQTNITYDHMYRIKSVDQYYNGGAVTHVAAYTYNELGQLIKKGLGYVNASTWLQNVDMRFNIRGQLLSINNSQLSNDSGITNSDTNDVFGMSMLYDQTDSNLSNTSYYDGKISAAKWMSKDGSGNKTPERAFRYNYDGVNRYVSSLYSERAAATGAFSYYANFNELVNYDAGGNITLLTRNISTIGGTTPVQIDNVTYTYDPANPNQLSKVADGTDANHTGAGFRNLTGSTGNYTYDGNGNLASDPYKGLTLAYNVFNKTDKITVTTAANRWADYTYASDGTLLRKRQYDNNILQTTTDYIDGFVYVTPGTGAAALQYFPMPEGRVLNTGTGTSPIFTQEFVISDQQGNARVSFQNNGSGAAIVKQENSYYPTGLIMPNSPVAMPTIPNKQLYNGGSEWQNDFANLPDYYMTFNRNYDAAIARFIGVDPVAESAESMTSYQYAGNNPVMFNDPLGDLIPTPGSHDINVEYWAPLYQNFGVAGILQQSEAAFEDAFSGAVNESMIIQSQHPDATGPRGTSLFNSVFSTLNNFYRERNYNDRINNSAAYNSTLNSNGNGIYVSFSWQSESNSSYERQGARDLNQIDIVNHTSKFYIGDANQGRLPQQFGGGWVDPSSFNFIMKGVTNPVFQSNLEGVKYNFTAMKNYKPYKTLGFEIPKLGLSVEASYDIHTTQLLLAKAFDLASTTVLMNVARNPDLTNEGAESLFLNTLDGALHGLFGENSYIVNFNFSGAPTNHLRFQDYPAN